MPATGFDSILARQTSFLQRIRENFKSVWALPRAAQAAPHSANNAPIHLLDQRRTVGNSGAQLGSMGAHLVLCGALILSVWQPGANAPRRPITELGSWRSVEFAAPKWMHEAAADSVGRRGTGGAHNPLPPTLGVLAPPARMVLVPPRLPDGRPHPLPIEVTTFDPDAPEFVSPVKDLGLPSMNVKNGSAGPGTNGVGNHPGAGMGDGLGDGSGWGGSNLPYGRVATQVMCLRCPDPVYSDEARKAKLQGLVTMRVLVGADGRARDVQLTHGIGLGLDENATRAVRNWQFIPAKDSARRPIATWITIETAFRLF